VNLPIRLFAVVQKRKCVLQGRSHDLSLEGMAIYIPAELYTGQMVQIEFSLPELQQKLGVHAIVRCSTGFRCGVEFQNLTPLDLESLARSCKKLAAAASLTY
jgi:c-di-GMP-binding flagellar brake protein YcgR